MQSEMSRDVLIHLLLTDTEFTSCCYVSLWVRVSWGTGACLLLVLNRITGTRVCVFLAGEANPP